MILKIAQHNKLQIVLKSELVLSLLFRGLFVTFANKAKFCRNDFKIITKSNKKIIIILKKNNNNSKS